MTADIQRCREQLEPVLERDRTHKWRDILLGLNSGQMQLWEFEKSCGVTLIQDYPRCRVLCLFVAAGDLQDILSHEEEITEFARDVGCELLEVCGRPGWSKVAPGFKLRTMTLCKRI